MENSVPIKNVENSFVQRAYTTLYSVIIKMENTAFGKIVMNVRMGLTDINKSLTSCRSLIGSEMLGMDSMP